jgi:hypothetical protein
MRYEIRDFIEKNDLKKRTKNVKTTHIEQKIFKKLFNMKNKQRKNNTKTQLFQRIGETNGPKSLTRHCIANAIEVNNNNNPVPQ